MKRILVSACLVLTLCSFVGCQTTTSTTTGVYDYSDFSDLIIGSVEAQLSMPEADYYIYYYGTSCAHCATIKNQVLNILHSLANDVVYIVAVSHPADVDPATGVTVTPSLIKVSNHLVVELYDSPSEVLSALGGLS
jgi:hypothetical protein